MLTAYVHYRKITRLPEAAPVKLHYRWKHTALRCSTTHEEAAQHDECRVQEDEEQDALRKQSGSDLRMGDAPPEVRRVLGGMRDIHFLEEVARVLELLEVSEVLVPAVHSEFAVGNPAVLVLNLAD